MTNLFESKHWCKTFEDTDAGLGQTQLVSGAALLISTNITYRRTFTDPHALLALSLTLLAICSQTIPTIALVRTKALNRWAKVIRLLLWWIELSMFVALDWNGTTDPANQTPFDLLWVIRIVSLVNYVTLAVLTVFLFSRPAIIKRVTVRRWLSKVAAYLSTILTAFMIFAAIWLKYFQTTCDMRVGADNECTLGQMFVVVMQGVPLMAAWESFRSEHSNSVPFENRHY